MLTRDMWWNLRGEAAATELIENVRSIYGRDSHRQSVYLISQSLYGSEFEAGLTNATACQKGKQDKRNVVASAVEGVVSRVTKRVPSVKFSPSGTDHGLRLRARGMTRFVQYAFRVGKSKRAFRRAFTDAAVYGTGCVLVSRDEKVIRFKRVRPQEFLVDQCESLDGETRTLYRHYWVTKSEALERWPKNSGRVEIAGPPIDTGLIDVASPEYAPLVGVFEGWRIGRRGVGGRHVVALDSGPVVDESWDYDEFPVAFVSYQERQTGFWAKGIAEKLRGIQKELDGLISKRDSILDKIAKTRVFLQKSRQVDGQHHSINGMDATIYTGPAPVFHTVDMPPSLERDIDKAWALGHSIVGVSPVESGASMPNGITSGVAIQEYDAVVDGRFAVAHENFQDAWVFAAKWVMYLAKEIHEEFPKWRPTQQSDANTVTVVDWKKVDVKADEYTIGAFPVSSLPTNPSGRLQKVTDMFSSGIIQDVKEARRLLDSPDLENANTLDSAESDYFDWVAEELLEGRSVPVEPFDDAALGLRRIKAVYHRAQVTGVDEKTLGIVRAYLADLAGKIREAQQEQAKLIAPAAIGAAPAVGFNGAPPTAAIPDEITG